jgi:hypothetical protein
MLDETKYDWSGTVYREVKEQIACNRVVPGLPVQAHPYGVTYTNE